MNEYEKPSRDDFEACTDKGDPLYQGWAFIKASYLLVRRRPILALPIFCTWIIIAAVTLYAEYRYKFTSSFMHACSIGYLLILIVSLSVCISNIFMMEFVERMENGRRISMLKAAYEALIIDFINVIPLAIYWSIIWFVIVFIRALKRAIFRFASEKDIDCTDEIAMQGFAGDISKLSQDPLDWWRFGLNIFEKLLRMTVFLTLPAIAWEGKGSSTGFQKAVDIIKKHPVQFLTTYSLTEFSLYIMLLPLLPIAVLLKCDVQIPHIVWLITIIYEGTAWTFGIYMEQMSVSLLYLWHMKWEMEDGKGSLSDFPKPRILNAAKVIRKKQQNEQVTGDHSNSL